MSIRDEVMEWLVSYNEDGETPEQQAVLLRQLAEHGCMSGMVHNLIYYHDTCAFFEKHKLEIQVMLSTDLEEFGMSMQELFRDWDTTDPLVMDTQNQNTLAWYAFERTASEITLDIEEN
tara:strand:+ start:258 stop:614 length:357 start_codon:yes stop_codon:yes gene_type:complete